MKLNNKLNTKVIKALQKKIDDILNQSVFEGQQEFIDFFDQFGIKEGDSIKNWEKKIETHITNILYNFLEKKGLNKKPECFPENLNYDDSLKEQCSEFSKFISKKLLNQKILNLYFKLRREEDLNEHSI